ncbi:MAG: hypothetical protein GEV06_24935 [Luteitalea sp.]|nr:hypothetical protein [Luteitalea sp.]
MWSSVTVYTGLAIAATGVGLIVRPIWRGRGVTRTRGLVVGAAGAVIAGIGLRLPVRESRVTKTHTRLDETSPVWQFRERHAIEIDAPPTRVFEAIKRVQADEIFLFRTLTWMRRGGRQASQSILNPGSAAPLLDVATRSGFVRLADEPPHELVVGTVVLAPVGRREPPTPQTFQEPLPPGFATATMNFLVSADGAGGSRLSTETRVFANSASARRWFAAYWRLIYPGSALIRQMWLRAIKRRAGRGSLAV